MKEIDFLPAWYKSNRRQQINYRRQIIGLGGIFLAVMVWNIAAIKTVSRATNDVASGIERQASLATVSQEFARVQNEVCQFQKKAKQIEQINQRINVANVLAELSFLAGEKIVLSKVELTAERFEDSEKDKAATGSVVRTAGAKASEDKRLPLGEVRFKVVTRGVASQASEVAKLICRLEESPYFCHVIPSFSRNTTVKTGRGGAAGELPVSEFEISFYIANYQRAEAHAGIDEQSSTGRAVGL
jgi:hypothetical protein